MTLRLKHNPPKIVCFGDSQTQYGNSSDGFVSGLADVYQRKVDVITRGYSGYNSRDAYLVAEQIFDHSTDSGDAPILAVTVWIGCNDSIQEGQDQHISPENFAENLGRIYRSIVGANLADAGTGQSPYVLFLGPTPVTVRPFHDNESKVKYTKIVREVARKAGPEDKVGFIDLYRVFQDARQPLDELLDPDGIHIAPPGYKLIFDAVLEKLREQKGLDPDKMPMLFPDWKDLYKDGVHADIKP